MSHTLFSKTGWTIGDLYNAVLAIHDGAGARAFYEEYVLWTKTHAADPQFRSQEGAESLAKANIGWIFGEGMPSADVTMWTEACGAEHPVFGRGILTVTPEEAFEAGLQRGLHRRPCS